jgi:hypothetical protein
MGREPGGPVDMHEIILQGGEQSVDKAVGRCTRVHGFNAATIKYVSCESTDLFVQLIFATQFGLENIPANTEGIFGFVCTSSGSNAPISSKRTHEDVSPQAAYVVIRVTLKLENDL